MTQKSAVLKYRFSLQILTIYIYIYIWYTIQDYMQIRPMGVTLIHADGGKAPEICIVSFHVVFNAASVCVHTGTAKQGLHSKLASWSVGSTEAWPLLALWQTVNEAARNVCSLKLIITVLKRGRNATWWAACNNQAHEASGKWQAYTGSLPQPAGC
jgi:hypothetical protein